MHITLNKNAIPNDPEKPMVTSGVRIGTPAVTTRGLGVAEMDLIADYITRTIRSFDEDKEAIKAGVAEICSRFPLYE